MPGEHCAYHSFSGFSYMLQQVVDGKQAAHLHHLIILQGAGQSAETQVDALSIIMLSNKSSDTIVTPSSGACKEGIVA